MQTKMVSVTFSTREAAETRLECALEWGDFTEDQNPRVVAIAKKGARTRYAIQVQNA